jgi:Ca-activated chloride channel family protein
MFDTHMFIVSLISLFTASRFLQVGTLPPTVTVTGPTHATPGSEICVDLEVEGAGGSSSSSAPIDVVFAIDSSGSMSGTRRANAVAASKFFLSQLSETTDYAGVVSWDSNVDFALGMSNNFTEVNGWLDLVDASGGTNLNVGVDASVTLLDNAMALLASDGRVSDKVIVFINDGSGSYTPCASNPALQQAILQGYTIYSVLIGSSGSITALTDMATCTGGFFTQAISPADVQPILNAILTTVVSSTIPYNVVLTTLVDLSDFVVTSITPAPSSGLPALVWTVDDTTGGFEQGESSAYQICGTVPTTEGTITVLTGGAVSFEDVDGNIQTDIVVPPFFVQVKTNGAGGDPHFLLFQHEQRQTL